MSDQKDLPVTSRQAKGDDNKDFVEVTLGDVKFVLYESLLYPGVINVDVDGDLDKTQLRLHLNDNLVLDTKLDVPAIKDPRS